MPDDTKLTKPIERLEERVANEEARNAEILQRLREREEAPRTASEAAAAPRRIRADRRGPRGRGRGGGRR